MSISVSLRSERRPPVPPKLIALDMDGTLLDDQKRLSPANAAALRRAADQGVHIMLASGRMSALLFPFEKQLGMECFLVGWNGAACIHKLTNEHGERRRVFEEPVPADVSDQLLDFAAERDLHTNFYLHDKLYAKHTSEANKKFADLYQQRANIKINFVDSLQQFKGKSPTKMLFINHPEHIAQLEVELRSMLGSRAHITRSDPEYLEILHPSTNKGEGVARACKVLGVELDQVIAFGDADNDVEMLAKVGYGIAVANANKRAKEAAAHVSQWSNNEDVVAKELERFVR